MDQEVSFVCVPAYGSNEPSELCVFRRHPDGHGVELQYGEHTDEKALTYIIYDEPYNEFKFPETEGRLCIRDGDKTRVTRDLQALSAAAKVRFIQPDPNVHHPYPDAPVTFIDLDMHNWKQFAHLRVKRGEVVDHNMSVIAEANFDPGLQLHGIIANGQAGFIPVGFVAIKKEKFSTDSDTDLVIHHLMVDSHYRGRGYGRQTVDLLVEYAASLRDSGVTQLCAPVHEGPGGPEGFFEKCKFVSTGVEVSHAVMYTRALTGEDSRDVAAKVKADVMLKENTQAKALLFDAWTKTKGHPDLS